MNQYIPTYEELRESYPVTICESILSGCWKLASSRADVMEWELRFESVDKAKAVIDYLRAWREGKELREHVLRRVGKRIVCAYAEGGE